SGGGKGWEKQGGAPAATWPSSIYLVMPLLTRQSPTALQASALPAWGKPKITTSHLFQDAPRDDGYCWIGEEGKRHLLGFALLNLTYTIYI
ncbi:MAG: hypothetical protein KJ921_04060, partial [Proteobacteria bacterium]|nr:hypothetical protein [Pseudomonadota bacterium]